MRSKPIVVIAVLILVSLSIAGCITTTNQTAGNTTSAETHDAFLEKELANYKQVQSENFTIRAWEVTWKNSTSAEIEYTAQNKTTNSTSIYKETDTLFASTEAATNYLNSLNKSEYTLITTTYPRGGPFERTAGHAPSVYKRYERINFNDTVDWIIQLDNLIVTDHITRLPI